MNVDDEVPLDIWGSCFARSLPGIVLLEISTFALSLSDLSDAFS